MIISDRKHRICIFSAFFLVVFVLGNLSLLAQTEPPRIIGTTPQQGPANASSIEGAQGQQGMPTAPPSARKKMILDRAKTLQGIVTGVSKSAKGVGVPSTERDAWTALAETAEFKGVVSEAQKLLTLPIPLPNAGEYAMGYGKTSGDDEEADRSYEEKYNLRRARFQHLVLAECIENQGRFLSEIEKTILVICKEPVWSLPKDDPGGRKIRQETITLDSNTARTAWNLATADYWLGNKLAAEIRDLVRQVVQARVFAVYERAVEWEAYEPLAAWADSSSSANPAGHVAVVGAALALIDSAQRRTLYLTSAETNVEKFAQTLSRDGYFYGGVGAWNEGFGAYVMLGELMSQATGGRIDLLKRPQTREAALFGLRMEVTPEVYEMFGNSRRGGRPQLTPAAFFSKRFNLGFVELENKAPFFGVGPGPLYRVGLFCFKNSASEEKGKTAQVLPLPVQTLRTEFTNSGVFVLRSGKKDAKQLGVVIKSGNNNEPNNHNDSGSYVVVLGGGAPLTEIGLRAQMQGILPEELMLSNFVNSFGHPVPRIEGRLQISGKEAVTPLLLREYTEDKDTLKFDLSYLYPWSSRTQMKELSRTFVYDRSGSDPAAKNFTTFKIIDRFRHQKPYTFENCLITFGPFTKLTKDVESTTIELIIGEGDQAIHVTVSNEVMEVSEKTKRFVKEPKPLLFEAGQLEESVAGNSSYPFRLAFRFSKPVDDATLTVLVRPATNAERNLAKSSPGEPDRIYASPLDHRPKPEVAMEGVEGAEGSLFDGGDNAQNELILQAVRAQAPAAMIETIKSLSMDEEALLAVRTMIRTAVPQTAEMTDEQMNALILYLKENL